MLYEVVSMLNKVVAKALACHPCGERWNEQSESKQTPLAY